MKALCSVLAFANLGAWFVVHEPYSLIIGNVWSAAYVILRAIHTQGKGEE